MTVLAIQQNTGAFDGEKELKEQFLLLYINHLLLKG